MVLQFIKAFVEMPTSTLPLSSITRKKLAQRHKDSQLGSNFHTLAINFNELCLAHSSSSLPYQYDIGLKVHPFSSIRLQNIVVEVVAIQVGIDAGLLAEFETGTGLHLPLFCTFGAKLQFHYSQYYFEAYPSDRLTLAFPRTEHTYHPFTLKEPQLYSNSLMPLITGLKLIVIHALEAYL